ncbi:phosphate ABC transporter permease PstA [Chamaesiphon minutus]|uniref:Phosphate transport system permease protein PstA n=1 Tax=Chamaesiphon minutus (strain ATCC 27169 / PCC 6605) TaxID=1173020 RepID=K9UIR7_CHAP6|nr:phosphate ABC transporter permease PstA [Chamaesiphon minutus]AFY94099.1 phosphate ABC transporter, permease protein PstA [Chamaesiphon minutus PCC 6605]
MIPVSSQLSTTDRPDNNQFGVSPSRQLFGKVMTGLVFACVAISIIPLASILFMVITNGLGGFSPAIFTELPPAAGMQGGGFRNAIVGTLLTCAIGAIISIPFGVLAAIYTVEFGQGNWISQLVRFCTNVLSGVPSIIAGLFAYGIVVLLTGGFSAVAGGAALSVLMLPTIIRTSEEGLKSVPKATRLAAVGIGATNFQTVTQIVLPAALPFVATGVTLAIARAAGETAPLLFTALFNQYDIKGLWEPTATLSVLIYNFAISPYPNQQKLAWVAALLIVLLILSISIFARLLSRRKVY